MFSPPVTLFNIAAAPTAVLKLACRLAVASLFLERQITNGGILSASEISKDRGIANGIVTESGRVAVERKGADSTVEDPRCRWRRLRY